MWKQAATELVDLELTTPSLKAAETLVGDQLLALTGKPDWKGLTPEQRKTQILAIVNQALKPVKVPEPRRQRCGTSGCVRFAPIGSSRTPSPTLLCSWPRYLFDRPDLATEPIGDIVPEDVRPPSLHTARAIYAQGLGRTNLDFTANISASWFSEVRPGMSGRFRDIKAGFEGTFRLRDIANFGAPSLTVAALYVYLHQEPLGLGPSPSTTRRSTSPDTSASFSRSWSSRQPTTPCGFRCRSPTRIGPSSSTRPTYGGRSVSRSISIRCSWIGSERRGRSQRDHNGGTEQRRRDARRGSR